MELTTQSFQPHKIDARSARKMADTCAVNVVFICTAITVLCILICTILTYDFFFFLERFCKNGYFLKHSRFRNQNQHFRFLSYLHIENTKMHFFVCNVPTWEQELSHSIISKHVENFSYIVVTSNYKNNMLVLLS